MIKLNMMKKHFLLLAFMPLICSSQTLKINKSNKQIIKFNGSVVVFDTTPQATVSCDSIVPCDVIIPCDVIYTSFINEIYYIKEIGYFKHEESLIV